MKILFTNYSLIIKAAFIVLLLFVAVNSSYGATFAMSTPATGASITYNSTASLTIKNAPGGTVRVDYYVNGTNVGSGTSGPTFPFSEVASVPGTYTIYGLAYNVATGGTVKGTTATITIYVYPPAPTISGGGTGCMGSVTVSATDAATTGGTYNWYNVSSGGTAVSSGTSSTYAPTSAGTYYVSYTYGGLESSRTTTGKAVAFSASPTITTVPTSGAYFSYPFSGNTNDVSGSGNTGTIHGTVTLSTDRFGNANKAYTFDGSTGYISTANGIVAPGPQNFSISVWFKTSSAGGMLVGYSAQQTGVGTQYDRHIYMDDSGDLIFGLYNGAADTISTTSYNYADGNWHNVIATCSSTLGSNLYVDGELIATDATMTTPETYTVNGYWRVAYNTVAGTWKNPPTDQYFNGQLDDIAVYSSTLTASQVYTAYGAGSTPVCANSPLTLQVNSVAGATYSWTGPNGFSSTLQNPTVSSLATTAMVGTYTCNVSTSAFTCSSPINVTTVVSAPPSTTFTATSTVAVGANATITYTGTDPATSTFTWDFNGGSPSTGTGKGPFTVNWTSGGTKTITLTVTNANGCSATSTQTVTVTATALTGYAYSKYLTLNTSSMGISSTLANFPMLVYIQDNNLKINTSPAICTPNIVQYPNGTGPGSNTTSNIYNYDLAFTTVGSTTELNYQVDYYDQTNGILLVWVKVPSVTSTNSNLNFYFGSIAPSHTAATATGTWASDYQAVYHFNENSTSGINTILDATSNAKNATPTSTATGTGEIRSAASISAGGGGYTFNGTSSYISSTSTANLTTSFTLSAWVKVASFTVDDQKVVTNEVTSGLGGGYKLSLYGGTSTTVYDEVETRNSSGASTLNRSATGGTTLTAGNWYYVQGVYNSSTNTFYTYRNGVQDRTSTGAAAATGSNIVIGTEFSLNTAFFNGVMDEVRISNVAKTADWIKAEYYNQANPLLLTNYSASDTEFPTSAATIPGCVTYTWSGSASTDPTVATNWTNTTTGASGQLPAFNGSETFIIPTGLTNYPTLTANESMYGLTVASGASLNLGGFTLSVGCNIYNTSGGQLLYGSNNSSGITWNGTLAAQSYNGSTTTGTAELGSMTINNTGIGGTVTISGGPVDIFNTLTLTQGNLSVGASPAALTLKSTATNTASVATLGSGCTVTGTVSVERYITGGAGYRGYRLISSPVNTGTADADGNKLSALDYIFNTTYVSGSAFPTSTFSKVGNPCFYLYRENIAPSNASFISGNFRGIASISSSPYYLMNGDTGPFTGGTFDIPIGNGILYFFRGGTGTTSPFVSGSTPAAATVTATGTLNQKTITVTNWYTPTSATLLNSAVTGNSLIQGFNLVGNPYASSIDWHNFQGNINIVSANLNPTAYEILPGQSAYGTYNANTAAVTNGGSNIIVSGQGFYVKAKTTGTPTLTFTENAKTTTAPPSHNFLLRSLATNTTAYNQYLRLNISKDTTFNREVLVGFNPGSNSNYNAEEDDSYFPGQSTAESIWLTSADNVNVVSKWMAFPGAVKADTANMTVNALNSGQYTLTRTELNAIPNLYDIWLMDNYKKDSLDIKHNTTYIFNINLSDSASFSKNRFKVIIRQDPALGVHLLNFTATKVNTGDQVIWKTENEANYTNFTVQRSVDGGANFSSLSGFVSSAQGAYSYLDANPVKATADLYRLQVTDLNGTVSYSNIVTLMYANEGNSLVNNALSIYPNPTKGVLNINIQANVLASSTLTQQSVGSGSSSSTPAAVYGIKIVNNLGSIIQTATTSQTEWQTDVSGFIPGTYIIQVVNNTNNTLVGQGTFIKL